MNHLEQHDSLYQLVDWHFLMWNLYPASIQVAITIFPIKFNMLRPIMLHWIFAILLAAMLSEKSVIGFLNQTQVQLEEFSAM